MLKQKNGQIGFVTVILAVVFTLGLVLGAVALYYAPEDSIREAAESFVVNKNSTFWSLFKENLVFELMWLLLLWVMGSSTVTAPFMGAVISLRGFVMGFSVSFMLTGEFDRLRLFLCNILPQCITALPIMSIFIIVCMVNSSDRKYKGNYQTEYFLRGLLFTFITAAVSIIEVWLMIAFEKIC